jgi:hypothetical protein
MARPINIPIIRPPRNRMIDAVVDITSTPEID